MQVPTAEGPKMQCHAEESLLFAYFDDGRISKETCDFIGTSDRHVQDDGHGFCELNDTCRHFTEPESDEELPALPDPNQLNLFA